MKRKFKILDVGNFYFPVLDKGKKFIVESTIDVVLDKKDIKLVKEFLKQIDALHFSMLSVSIWNALKKEFKNKPKNCWAVPIRLYKLGEEYICVVDILRKIGK